MKTRTYTVRIHPCDGDEGGFWVEVPALPGCVTQGETIEEAMAMAKDVVTGYLESLVKLGEPFPEEPALRGDVTALISVDEPEFAR